MIPGLQDRHVHELRLTATSNDDLWWGRVLLEDAFQTASLPGIPAGRLVLVKRFSIGGFSTQHGTASLSRVIDHKFLELASQAVSADHPSAKSRPVVYFRDEVEPFVKLAVRIAANQETSSWFWPLAARGWQPTMSKSEGLRATLVQVAESRAGPAGVAALVGELHRLSLLESLLANLEHADASRLMRSCGWSERSAPSAGESAESVLDIGLSLSAQVVLANWVKHWTTADVRSIWLAAVLLVEQKPVRLLDQELIQRAVRLIEVLSKKSAMAELFASKASLSGGKDTARSAQRAESPAIPDLATNRGIPKRAEQVSNEGDASLYSLAPKAFALEVNKRRKAGAGISSRRHETATEHFLRGAGSATSGSGDYSSNTRSLDPPQSSETVLAGDSIREPSDTPDRLELSQSSKPETIPETFAAASETAEDSEVDLNHPELNLTWANAPQITEFGGFYFLLGLMSCLQVGDFLKYHPRLIEFDFPRRLLRFAADQLQIPKTDPVVTSLLELENLDCPEIQFSVPQIWRELLYPSGALLLSTIDGRLGYRMLTDRSGRSVLSIWRGRAPASVRRLIGTSRIARVAARRCEDDSRALLTCWYRALVHWGRRVGRIGLGELVRRRGVLSVSRTHLDLFFDLNAVDIRIRRAGLDLNPGWMPWFGRVVSFHYLEKEEIDGRK